MTDMLTPQMSHDEAVERFTGGLAPSVDVIAPFNGSNRLRPDGRPKPEFRAELRKIPNAMNAFHTVFNLGLPALYISAAVAIDHPIGWVAAYLAMGVYFQRILTLHHEAAHRLLFSKRAVNDWVGEKLIGWLVFGDGGNGYRLVHTQHHRDEFGEKEPDFLLYAYYPISRASLRRKMVRDISGVSGYKNLKPAFVGLFKKGRRTRAARYLSGQLAVFALFFAFGHPWLYLFLWVLPWATMFRVFNRLRALAEHGGMTRSDDRRLTSHNIKQGFMAKHLFLSQGIGYHLAHHVDSGIPMANLAKLHRALEEDGYISESFSYPGYWNFIGKLWRKDG